MVWGGSSGSGEPTSCSISSSITAGCSQCIEDKDMQTASRKEETGVKMNNLNV